MESDTGPSLDDIGRARRSLQEAKGAARNAKVLPGDPARGDVDRLETDQALRHAQDVGAELRTRTLTKDTGDPRVGGDEGGGDDAAGDDQGGRGVGLLSTAAHVVSAVVGNFSESLKTGVDSVSGAVQTPPTQTSGGGGEPGGGVRVRDMLGGSESDTPYPGDAVDEPVQLEGGGGTTDKTEDGDKGSGSDDPQFGFGGQVVGGATPHVLSEQRLRDPDVVTPLEGGPGTTIRDSGVMVNTGPTAGGGARAQGFGFGGSDAGGGGDTLGLLGVVKEALTTVTGGHTVDGSVGGFNLGASVTGPGDADESFRLSELRERMVGMPGSMPIDKEIREQREAQAAERIAALAAQREAVSSAARDSITERHPDVADRMGLPTSRHQHNIHDGRGADQQKAERGGATAAASGGGGGLLSSLAHTLGDVLGLGGGGGSGGGGGGAREERERETEERSGPASAADLPRKPVPTGTSPLEAKPLDKTAIGVPAAAEADAERGSSSINTKESGREVPAGALGATVTDPSQHNPSFAPDFNKPNFFAEVEKRGLGDVLAAGAASLRGSAEQAMEEIRHGGAPAPGATTSGAVADTKDITRNVERADHLDDPVQRRIYDAEVVRVSPGQEAAADRRSGAEAVKEATSALVLGKDRQVSGAEPHGVPEGPHPAPPLKQQAGGQSFFGSFGTGSAAPRRGREVKDAFEDFIAATSTGTGTGTDPGDGDGDGSSRGGRWVAARLSSPRRRRGSATANGDSGGGGGVVEVADGGLLAAARHRGLVGWAARVGAAFTAKAAGGEVESPRGPSKPNREQQEQHQLQASEPGESGGGGGEPSRQRQPYNRNPDDPAGYADAKIHSGVLGGARAKEPSGKEIKDAQYLKVYQEPHSKVMHIQGANFNWDRNKDREAGQTTIDTDNPTLFETAGRSIHKGLTGEHYEGVPPMGYDSPGGRETAFQVAKDTWAERAHKAPEIGADVAARTEESVVGVLEHISQAAGQAASSVARVVATGLGDPVPMDQRLAEAAARQEERETVYEQDWAPASPASAVRQRRLDQMDTAGDPALKRDTLVDKVLYPWTKDASTDDSAARKTAESYKAYVREKEEKGEPYDPLGAMAHDREYDTSKLPATVQQVERSRVDSSLGERHGNNQQFLAERAPHAGQAPLPEGAKTAIRSMAEDLEASGRPGVGVGLQGLQERVAEEEERGGARGALKTRGPPPEDREAYRDPHSDKAWHAAEVLQTNIDRTALGSTTEKGIGGGQQREGGGGVRQVAEAAARDATEAGKGVAGTVRGAAEMAGEEARRAVGAASGAAEVVGEEARRAAAGTAGTVRGAAEVAGEEVKRAVGAAGGAVQVAGEEASRATGGLIGTIQQGLRSLVGGAGDKGHGREHPHELHQHHPGATTYSDAPRAISDIYHDQKRQQEQDGGGGEGKSAVDRAGESVGAVGEDMSRRTEGAKWVVGDTARQTTDSAAEAAERGMERAREGAGGLLGALRDLFVGGGEHGGGGSREEESRERGRGGLEDMGGGGGGDDRGGSGASDVAPGVEAGDIGEGLGRVVGGIAGVVEKVLGGGGKEGGRGETASPAGPDVPVVPYTSTAEILAARQQGQEQQ